MYKAGDLISIGSWSSLTKKFTAEHVREFSALSEDRNPIHLDDAYAAQTQFGRKIVHGFLSASLISAIAGTALPGPGTIYLNQTLQFRKPVFVDDTVTAAVKVLSIRHTKRLVTFETTCYNQNDDVVISGQALVLVPADRLPPSPPADSDTS
jgi:3-hydroxybutyryl-CoA dehydratase